jgi:glyoxylase-like metal-dependent hydrolase (beta-lactamase superfamily II)
MQQVAAGVEVATSRYWRTNSGLIRTEAGVVMVDAGVLPNEMRALAEACDGSPIVAGISTHEHWDHLLWSAALGVDVPRYASSIAAGSVIANRAALLRRLASEEDGLGVRWDRDLFGRTVAHDVGTSALDAAASLRLIDLPGHAAGQIGVWVDGAGVLFAGDTVSDIDPPALPADRAGARVYLETLSRMEDLVSEAQVVVPGHGTPCGAAEARERIARDRRYVHVLLEAIEQAHAPLDVDAVCARTAAVAQDARLDSPGGRQLHVRNVTDLLGAA